MQRSLDDLGTPLSEVTFVVIDLETTGGSPATDAITEVGAVKLRGGECLGTLSTLVNPGRSIPPLITYLTGITEWMVAPAPSIDTVLPALVEFVGDAVIVGHNVSFDLRFLAAALEEHGWDGLTNRVVDTCTLARRLIREEVPDCKLHTLAARLRLSHQPCHRALDDALATGDLLHALLERAAGYGVLGLEDLLALPTAKGHAQLSKLPLTRRLPRRPGVYLFRDGGGRVLYVGKAVDLRRRVRSYFAGPGDERRKAAPMLRELAAIDHIECAHELEARTVEIRLIHALSPRYNTEAKHWQRYHYVKLTLAERYPRLAVVRSTPADGSLYLGPVASGRAAHLVVEAIESVVGLRRCRGPVRRGRTGWCTPAQLGVSVCPCGGQVDEGAYAGVVDAAVRGMTGDPRTLLAPLLERVDRLSGALRYEEAADTRDRAGALARVLNRQRRLEALVAAGRIAVTVPGEGGAVIEHGRLAAAWGPGDVPFLSSGVSGAPRSLPAGLPAGVADAPGGGPAPGRPIPREDVDEVAAVSRWLEARAGRAAILQSDAAWSWPAWRLDELAPGPRGRRATDAPPPYARAV